jgi:hypothetical protein
MAKEKMLLPTQTKLNSSSSSMESNIHLSIKKSAATMGTPNSAKRHLRGKSTDRAKGQGLVEVCIGAIFLVAIGLAILDLGTFVMGGDVCGTLSKQAARAAGNAASPSEAQQAVASVQSTFKPSNVYKNLSLTMTNFDNTTTGVATVVGQVTVILPVSIPLLQIGPSYTIKTQATEPIVGIAPAPQT